MVSMVGQGDPGDRPTQPVPVSGRQRRSVDDGAGLACGGTGLGCEEQERPQDGRHWIEVRLSENGNRYQFPSTGNAPVLDDGL